MTKACPKLTWKCRRTQTGGVACLVDGPDGERLGRMYAERQDDYLAVTMVKVDPSLRRCGVATKLYQRMLGFAREDGLALASDVERTKATESFWKKQVEKGRARCVTQERGKRGGRQLGPDLTPKGRGWKCRRYVLTTKGSDLSGVRR